MGRAVRISIATVALCAGVGQAVGQNASSRPEFEVASVKPSPPPEGRRDLAIIRGTEQMQNFMPARIPIKGRTVSLQKRSLAQLVALAYRAPMSEVVAPGWASDARFDIEAKLPEGESADSANEMLRALLEDRFGLRAHRETRMTGGHALVVAKDGPRLAAATPAGPMPDEDEMKARMQKNMAAARGRGGSYSWWSSKSATMAQVAQAVAGMIHGRVVDETGLSGKCSVRLEVPGPETPDEPVEYRVAQALGKVGLKLESRKTAVEFVVVDSAARAPVEN